MSGGGAGMSFTAAIAAALACASCQPRDDASQSLVGADPLPSPAELSREIIQINRGYGTESEGFLSYELRPDDMLTVTHSDRRRDQVVGEDRFRLPSGLAAQARRRLWRVRPARLEGLDAHEARPTGCERRGPHDFGELAVVFVREPGGPGAADDAIGVFELPDAGSCVTAAAIEARALVRDVLGSFPRSRVAEGFRP